MAAPTTKQVSQEHYLMALAEGCSRREACEAAGIARATEWRWRQDPEFARQAGECMRVTLPKLEAEAERRALKSSDKLLMFLLERKDPAKYNLAQKVEHSGASDLVAAIYAARGRAGV